MEEEFDKDQYIVVLPNFEHEVPAFLPNYVYKQRMDYPFLRPYFDMYGSSTNGWPVFKAGRNGIYRSATWAERAAYDRAGRPCRVGSYMSIDDYSII